MASPLPHRLALQLTARMVRSAGGGRKVAAAGWLIGVRRSVAFRLPDSLIAFSSLRRRPFAPSRRWLGGSDRRFFDPVPGTSTSPPPLQPQTNPKALEIDLAALLAKASTATV